MPEGPEIFIMVKKLNKKFKNSKIKTLNILSGRYITHGLPKNYNEFLSNLPANIIKFDCKGKLIWISLDNKLNIVITMGYAHFINEIRDNTPFEFITSKGNFYLRDVRHFATINFLSDQELIHKLNKRGPSIITNELTKKNFISILEKIKNKEQKIGNILLDQYKISGIGNYIRNDALYLSKISPFRMIKDISINEMKNLYDSLKMVINKSMNRQLIGKKYEFIVYQQKCINNKQVVRDLLNNRSVYWVPDVQK